MTLAKMPIPGPMGLATDRPESERAKEDRRLTVLVREAHERGRRYYGSPRVHRELAAQGIGISRKRVIKLMRQEGLVGRKRRRFKATTDSKHDRPIAPNILDRQFEAAAPNQRWVGDTTELLVGQGGAKAYTLTRGPIFGIHFRPRRHLRRNGGVV